MQVDILRWCGECHTCVEAKRLPITSKSALQQRLSGAPFERVAIDLMGPFDYGDSRNRYIVVLQDYFTKWVVAEPIRSKETVGIADVIYTKWITQYGCPYELHSDQGGEFTFELMKDLCAILRIQKTVTSVYHPQSDGMVERSNHTIQAMLRTYVNSTRNDWEDHLPSVICAYRATPHQSTGISPYLMLYGREMTMPIDLQYDIGTRASPPQCPAAYVEWMRLSLINCHAIARKQLDSSALRQKKGYSEKSRDAVFKPGDFVWKVDPVLRPGKLWKKNTGPWLVLKQTGPVDYKIQRSADSPVKVVHVDKLYPYHPEDGEILIIWVNFSANSQEQATQFDFNLFFETCPPDKQIPDHPQPLDDHPQPLDDHPQPLDYHPQPLEAHLQCPQPVDDHPQPLEAPPQPLEAPPHHPRNSDQPSDGQDTPQSKTNTAHPESTPTTATRTPEDTTTIPWQVTHQHRDGQPAQDTRPTDTHRSGEAGSRQ